MKTKRFEANMGYHGKAPAFERYPCSNPPAAARDKAKLAHDELRGCGV